MLRSKSEDIDAVEMELPVPKADARPALVDFASGATVERVSTTHGEIQVTILGDRKKPAMMAYHDIGLNHRTCFGGLVGYPSNKEIFDNVCLYFIDAPGAEDEAPTWPTEKPYPTFAQLVEQVREVAVHYGLNKGLCFGLGVGLGATILLHYATKYPKDITGILLVTFNWKVMTWSETYYYKQLAYYLYYYPQSTYPRDELLIRYFGRPTLTEGYDIVSAYQAELSRMNPVNLYHLINDAYMTRTDITADLSKIRSRIVVFAGWDSAYRDFDVELLSFLDKNETSYLEFHDKGGLLTEEAPNEFSVPVKFFFQAFGLCVPKLDIGAINRRLQAIQSDSDSEGGHSSESDSE